MVEYRIQGGLAGGDSLLVIDASGQALFTDRAGRVWLITLDNDTIKTLRKTFEEIRFSELNTEYAPDGAACCDLIKYTITYQGRTIKAMDTAAPDELWRVIDLLNGIIADKELLAAK